MPWSQRKSTRGRKKTVDTHGFACPQPGCEYFGITDADIHALVGYGWIDQAQTIRKFCCQRKVLIEKLKSVGLSGLIQAAFIERVNLTLRQSVAPLMRIWLNPNTP